ncbi:MAG TPA: cytochrome D1 domain-containing protein [Chthoniobacter sp.]|jgi:DNA-binding beta-propeller fold protein YncE
MVLSLHPAAAATRWLAIAFATVLFAAGNFLHAEDLLKAGPPVILKGTHGKFDFLAIDAEGRRLLAAHTGNGSLDVIDLDKHELVKSVATGAAQASAVNAAAGQYLVAVSKPPQVVLVDSAKLEPVAKIPLSGPADLITFNPKSGLAYVDHDDATNLWVVNPKDSKVESSIELRGEGPEDLGFDAADERLFQSIKKANAVVVIDLATGKVGASWPTAPAEAPHGMAFLPEDHAFLVAGGNGKLVMMSERDGHVLSSTDIPARVDQIAFDHGLHRVYCASGTGKIGVVKLEGGQLTTLGEVASSAGCHSITVDPKTHTVWIAYAKDEQSMVQPFAPATK